MAEAPIRITQTRVASREGDGDRVAREVNEGVDRVVRDLKRKIADAENISALRLASVFEIGIWLAHVDKKQAAELYATARGAGMAEERLKRLLAANPSVWSTSLNVQHIAEMIDSLQSMSRSDVYPILTEDEIIAARAMMSHMGRMLGDDTLPTDGDRVFTIIDHVYLTKVMAKLCRAELPSRTVSEIEIIWAFTMQYTDDKHLGHDFIANPREAYTGIRTLFTLLRLDIEKCMHLSEIMDSTLVRQLLERPDECTRLAMKYMGGESWLMVPGIITMLRGRIGTVRISQTAAPLPQQLNF